MEKTEKNYAFYNVTLSQLIHEAVDTIQQDIQTNLPQIANRISSWWQSLTSDQNAISTWYEYLIYPYKFPIFLLPWWFESGFAEGNDLAFQRALVTSTANAYLYVRLMDDSMDEQTTTSLIPLCSYFFSKFVSGLKPYFPHEHPFWTEFNSMHFNYIASTIAAAHVDDITAFQFESSSHLRTCLAKIPLLAVAYHHHNFQGLEKFMGFCDHFSKIYLFRDDFFDWHSDLKNNITTYFISECRRQNDNQLPLAEWILRHGLSWGKAWLIEQMDILQYETQTIGCNELDEYLKEIVTLFAEDIQKIERAKNDLVTLCDAIP